MKNGRMGAGLAAAIDESDKQIETLQADIEQLQDRYAQALRVPPMAWIEDKLRNVHEVLRRRTGASALVLRKVLGSVKLEPRRPDVGRDYYVAHTLLGVVQLLGEGRSIGLAKATNQAKKKGSKEMQSEHTGQPSACNDSGDPDSLHADNRSDVLSSWTRLQHIRTLATLPLEFPLADLGPTPAYQRIAVAALQLHDLGWTKHKIARHFRVDDKTAAKALNWACRLSGLPARPGFPPGSAQYQRIAKRCAEFSALGRSPDSIADELGVCGNTVRRALAWAAGRQTGGES